jgi:hypothetical protein
MRRLWIRGALSTNFQRGTTTKKLFNVEAAVTLKEKVIDNHLLQLARDAFLIINRPLEGTVLSY